MLALRLVCMAAVYTLVSADTFFWHVTCAAGTIPDMLPQNVRLSSDQGILDGSGKYFFSLHANTLAIYDVDSALVPTYVEDPQSGGNSVELWTDPGSSSWIMDSNGHVAMTVNVNIGTSTTATAYLINADSTPAFTHYFTIQDDRNLVIYGVDGANNIHQTWTLNSWYQGSSPPSNVGFCTPCPARTFSPALYSPCQYCAVGT